MTEISDIIDAILDEQHSLEMAESDFRLMLVDDADLRRAYKAWCAERGDSERRGFLNYAHERFEQEESRWDALASDEEDY